MNTNTQHQDEEVNIDDEEQHHENNSNNSNNSKNSESQCKNSLEESSSEDDNDDDVIRRNRLEALKYVNLISDRNLKMKMNNNNNNNKAATDYSLTHQERIDEKKIQEHHEKQQMQQAEEWQHPPHVQLEQQQTDYEAEKRRLAVLDYVENQEVVEAKTERNEAATATQQQQRGRKSKQRRKDKDGDEKEESSMSKEEKKKEKPKKTKKKKSNKKSRDVGTIYDESMNRNPLAAAPDDDDDELQPKKTTKKKKKKTATSSKSPGRKNQNDDIIISSEKNKKTRRSKSPKKSSSADEKVKKRSKSPKSSSDEKTKRRSKSPKKEGIDNNNDEKELLFKEKQQRKEPLPVATTTTATTAAATATVTKRSRGQDDQPLSAPSTMNSQQRSSNARQQQLRPNIQQQQTPSMIQIQGQQPSLQRHTNHTFSLPGSYAVGGINSNNSDDDEDGQHTQTDITNRGSMTEKSSSTSRDIDDNLPVALPAELVPTTNPYDNNDNPTIVVVATKHESQRGGFNFSYRSKAAKLLVLCCAGVAIAFAFAFGRKPDPTTATAATATDAPTASTIQQSLAPTTSATSSASSYQPTTAPTTLSPEPSMAPVPVQETCLCYQYSHEYYSEAGNVNITFNSNKVEEVYVGLTHLFAPTKSQQEDNFVTTRHYRNLQLLRGSQQQQHGSTSHRSLLTEDDYTNENDGVLIRTGVVQSFLEKNPPFVPNPTYLRFGVLLNFCVADQRLLNPTEYLLKIHDNISDWSVGGSNIGWLKQELNDEGALLPGGDGMIFTKPQRMQNCDGRPP